MKPFALLNLGLRFILELCLLAAVGYWGFQFDGSWPIRIGAGIGLPLLIAVVWGTFTSPKAPYLLQEPWRFGLEIVLFGVGAAALLAAGHAVLGIILAVVFLVNRVLLMALDAFKINDQVRS